MQHLDLQSPVNVLNTEFERKFPPEALGDEMRSNARVWKVFRNESMAHDAVMLEGWNKTLDILLIFSGLFSAVATAFIIESYKLLQPDNDAYMALALHALVIAANNTANIPNPSTLDEKSSNIPLWINFLWFTSLTLSLGVALLSILAKQWLGEYAARIAASASNLQDWAIRRTYFFDGLSSWQLPVFISVLPFVLHVALFLFWAGLACFLQPLSLALNLWISLLGCVLLTFWFLSILGPLWRSDCPSATPLLFYIRGAVIRFLALAIPPVPLLPYLAPIDPAATSSIFVIAHKDALNKLRERLSAILITGHSFLARRSVYIRDPKRLFRIIHRISVKMNSGFRLWVSHTKARIRYEADCGTRYDPSRKIWSWEDESIITSKALRWLSLSVSSSDASRVALQAMGSISPHSSLAGWLRNDTAIIWALKDALGQSNLSPLDATRFTRSLLCLAGEVEFSTTLVIQNILGSEKYPDIALLKAWAARDHEYIIENAVQWSSEPTPSLSSTAQVLLRHNTSFQLLPALLLCISVNDIDDTSWTSICVSLTGEKHPLVGHEGRLAAVDGLALGLVQKRWRNPQCALLLLPRLLNSVGPSIRISAAQLPSLVRYIASNLFRQQQLRVNAVLTRIVHLFHGLRWDQVPFSEDVLAHALWNITQAMLHNGRDVSYHIVRSISWIATGLLDDGFDSMSDHDWRVVSGGNLETSLNFLLIRRDDRMNSTLWEMLHTPHDQQLINTMCKMATALCYTRHLNQSDYKPLVDAFFSSPQLQIRNLQQIIPDVDDHHYDYDIPRWETCLKMLQHLLSLRPVFWHELSEVAKGTQESERVGRLARGLLDLGPCKACDCSDEWPETILSQLETSAQDVPILEDIRLLFGDEPSYPQLPWYLYYHDSFD